MRRYLTALLVVLALGFALSTLFFAYAWFTETELPPARLGTRVDLIAALEGVSCERGEEQAEEALRLAVFYASRQTFTTRWVVTVPSVGIVSDVTETQEGALLSVSPAGFVYTTYPQPYSVPENTPIRAEAFVYEGETADGSPVWYSMIEFDCTTNWQNRSYAGSERPAWLDE